VNLTRRRRVIIDFAAGLLLAIAVFAFWPAESEPRYNGMKLSEWLARYKAPPTLISWGRQNGQMIIHEIRLTPGPSKEEAAEAIRQIGTNALPWLVRWVAYEKPAWKNCLLEISTRFSTVFRKARATRKPYPTMIYGESPETRANRAPEAFYLLGRQALPAVKRLNEIEADKTHREASHRAWIALALIGKSIAHSDANTVSANVQSGHEISPANH
jgi:hypothetical protein